MLRYLHSIYPFQESLAIVFNGRWGESLYWIRHPEEAIMNGRAVEEDIDPEEAFTGYRMVSHVLISLLYLALSLFKPMFLPFLIGIGAHMLGAFTTTPRARKDYRGGLSDWKER